jgi:hypothetical protein
VGKLTQPMKGIVMKKYMVRVEIRGKVVFFNNRKIRTPFQIELADSDINLFKFAMNSSGISEYTIEDFKEQTEDTWEEKIIKPVDKDVVIEDLYIEEEPNTILEKLLRDERKGD